ncbi:DoxX-like family protein [Zobellia nedashkovskayae]|uniref:DoxX-like family protein n=1 Tax=Zobellia nedashkovskayae TaxID=2779510 RepID=UPI00188BF350|nr:DoxX-like family protein [Zobellia nedashkovskayae]
MKIRKIYKILTFCIATVWIVNGLFCKILNLVPRHEQIVARILGGNYSRVLTILIGLSEILMAIWVLSKFKTRLNAIAQITIVGSMNTLEFILVPDLLLWGKLNSLFAFLFILVVYFNEFYWNKKIAQQT